MSEVNCLWEAGCLLGEGPVWLEREQLLRFVDIKAGRLLGYHPDSGERIDVEVGGNPSFIVPAEDGSLLVGSRNAVHRSDGRSLGEVVAAIPEPAGNRTNDATVDDHGRLWLGTMDDSEAAPLNTI